MPDYTTLGISFPVPSDAIKLASLEAKLADDIRLTAITANQAIITEGGRAEVAAKAAAAADASAKDAAIAAQASSAVSTANDALAVSGGASSDAGNAVDRVTALESAAGFGPSTPTDGTMADIAANPATLFAAGLSATIVANTGTKTFESFGAGSGADDSAALTAAFAAATGAGGVKLIGQRGKKYRVKSLVTLPAGSADIDLQGATIEVSAGGSIVSPTLAPFLTTTSAAGVTRKGTTVVCGSVSGVAIGDLVSVESPVEWAAGVPLRQHYLVADVDASNGTVWVEGRVVGDIIPAQVTAAGKTGSLTVKFFKLAESLVIRNAVIDSPLRDDQGSQMQIQGYRHVLYDNVRIRRPFRTGINTVLCGIVRFANCSVSEHGYTTRDRGYVSLPSDPQALGFGYGFLVSNSFLAIADECSSYSGWHGFDFARGVSYAIVRDYTSSKDAFGISTHEGCWALWVDGGEFLGGLGITSRSPEIKVTGTKFATSLGQGIAGQGNCERIMFSNCEFDGANIANAGGGGVPISMSSGEFPAYTRSADAPYAEISNVTIRALSGNSTITVPGDLTIDGLRVKAAASGIDSLMTIKSTGSSSPRATLRGVTIDGVLGQSSINMDGWSKIDVHAAVRFGLTGVVNNSAIFYITALAGGTHVNAFGGSAAGVQYWARIMSGSATLNFFDVTCFDGKLLVGDALCVVKNAINNRTNTAALVLGGATVTQSVGNVVLAV